MKPLSALIVTGATRAGLYLDRLRNEELPPPDSLRPVIVGGVRLTPMQYTLVVDPRFLPLARLAAEHSLVFEVESDGVAWITEPFGLRGIDVRWTPDEPGFIVIKGSVREFRAPDLKTALQLAFEVVDRRASPSATLLDSISPLAAGKRD